MARRSDLKGRALGMMKALADAKAQGEIPEGSRRDIITKETTDEAILYLFAVLDHLIQDVSPHLPEGEAEQEMALTGMLTLMALREYIRPLPDPTGDEDLLKDDLREINRFIQEGLAAFDDEEGE